MQIDQVSCASCGAPITVPEGVNYFNCTYCGAGLTVTRSEGSVVTSLAEELHRTIELSSEQTRSSLRRLELQQKISNAQLRLADVQSEIHALQRGRRNPTANARLRTLGSQEIELIARLGDLRQEIIHSGLETDIDSSILVDADNVLAGSYGSRQWTLTFALCLLLGVFGAHRFYTGHIITGVIQLFTVGGFGVWWLIDLFLVGTGHFRDVDGYLLSYPQLRFGRSCSTSVLAFVSLAVAAMVCAAPVERQLFGLVTEDGSLGPLAIAGVVVAFLIGVLVFVFSMDRSLINRLSSED